MNELTNQVLNRIQNQPCTGDDLWRLGEELGKTHTEILNSLALLTNNNLIEGERKKNRIIYKLSEKGIIYVTMNFPPA